MDKTSSVVWGDILYYDENSPSGLRWKVYRTSCAQVNDIAVGLQQNGYYYIKYKDVMYKAHRVVWIMHNGTIPDGLFIDHIDRNRSNNKIENLRLVERAKNARNTKMHKDNTSGITGVGFYSSDGFGYWQATWRCIEEKKNKTRCFSVNKFGYDRAFEMACEYREKMINDLNNSGAGYSERHGTDE